MELSEYQIRLLEIVDHVRWQEAEYLNPYEYVLIRRALGEGDKVIQFELEQAAAFVQAHPERPASPPPGPQRSPWMNTWLGDACDVTALPRLNKPPMGNADCDHVPSPPPGVEA